MSAAVEDRSSPFRADVVAGIGLAAFAIPESMAYAGLAGLPPQAYVRPRGQAHTGNVGVLMSCPRPGVGQQQGDEDTRQPGEAGVRDARP
jgi:hypothetical protein